MTRNVVIESIGQTEFGESKYGIRKLGANAVHSALSNSQFESEDIEAAYVGNLGGPADRQRSIVGQYCLREVGITGIPIVNIENACSSSANAFRQAYRSVAGGFEDVVLVLGVEKMTGTSTEEATAGLSAATDVEREADRGFTFVSLYAMWANAYQAKYKCKNLREALTKISVKNHSNALSNPYAHFQKKVTEEEVLKSPLIAAPLRLYDVCPISDGASAAILVSEDFVSSYSTKITVEASVHRTGQYDTNKNIIDVATESEAVKKAINHAGTSIKDIDVFEVHDATTFGELLHYEELGLCAKGEGPNLTLSGETEIEGKYPVNPSGGLKARGHPVGATGVAQINEIVLQLQGTANGRQVVGANIGLAQNSGGGLNGVSANTTVHILKAH
ncbi:hypothetical protein AKJ39_04150 [candidate division MSBL1 archaeon SCGC-AAA259J03]|uniref:Acetyl-CoA acetyltransferase n=1 Tax=candidate division MSBL1 archaeon SCGC-AAA259J03 TaxID=1698269 RepID=A0A656YX12_9EURY|nr:hypothetical protein AKJ39_04150 [candidate division MSBL1 archaeon SCGC-AAA259J03]